MMLLIALLAGYASFRGVFDQGLYRDLLPAGSITEFLVRGSVAQDIVTLPLGLALFVLALVFLKKPGLKVFVALLGLNGYFFYGYGLYAIQGQYTSLYPAYLAIFGLSLYGFIAGLTSFHDATIQGTELPKVLRALIGVFLLLIPLVLVPVWLGRMGVDVSRHAPGETYGVFILDLCVVFPALVIIAVMLFKNSPFGGILAGIALMKVLTICLSVAFGEWFVARAGGMPPNYGMIGIFGALTLFSFVLGSFYLRRIKGELT